MLAGIDGMLIGREEGAALKDGDSGQLPAAGQSVKPARGREPGLAVAEGQVVEIGGKEAVAAVVDDVAVIEAGMKTVSKKVAAGNRKGAGRGAAGVGEVAREVVACVEGERLAAVAGDFDGAAVVVAAGGIRDALDDGPAGIGAMVGEQSSAIGDAGSGAAGAGSVLE